MAQEELAIIIRGRDMASGALKSIAGRFLSITAAVYALQRAFRAAMTAAIEFDRQLHNVWTLVNKTWVQMQQLGRELRSLALDFNITGAQGAKALYQIYSAVFYGAEAFEILTVSIKGAAAGLSDVFTVADMMTTVLNAFGLAASESGHIMDLLFTTIKYGKTTMPELAQQFGRLAGVAAPVGARIEEMTAAIATLTRQGIMTDWAITSLRQTLMQFLRPPAELAKIIAALGYESGSALIHALGFAEALGLVTEYAAANGIRMEQLFTNVRAVTAVLPLATTAAAGFAKDLERMARATGTYQVAFAKQIEAARYKLDRLKTAWTDFSVAITEGLAVTFADFAENVLTPFLAAVTKAVDKAKELRAGREAEAAAAAGGVAIGGEALSAWLAAGNELPKVITGFLNRVAEGIGITAEELMKLYKAVVVGQTVVWELREDIAKLTLSAIEAARSLEIVAGGLTLLPSEAKQFLEEIVSKRTQEIIAHLSEEALGQFKAAWEGLSVLGLTSQTFTEYLEAQIKATIDEAEAIADVTRLTEEYLEVLQRGVETYGIATEDLVKYADILTRGFKLEIPPQEMGQAIVDLRNLLADIPDQAVQFKIILDILRMIPEQFRENVLTALDISRDDFITWLTDLWQEALVMPPAPAGAPGGIADILEEAWTAVKAAVGDHEALNAALDTFYQTLREGTPDIEDFVDRIIEFGQEAGLDAKILEGLYDRLKDTHDQYESLIAVLKFFGMSTEKAEAAAKYLADALGIAASAAQSFAAQIAALKMPELVGETGALLEEAQQAVKSALGGDGAISPAIQNLIDAGATIKSTADTLEMVANSAADTAPWTAEERVQARAAADALNQFSTGLGQTDEQIADAAKSAAAEAARLAKQQAREAEQAAKQAAQAAQEAFREQFRIPILEAVETGDWEAAAGAVKLFAASRDDLIAQAAALSAANGQIIDAAEVMGMILSAEAQLFSSIENEIKLRQILGQDTSELSARLRELKIALGEILFIPDEQIRAQAEAALAAGNLEEFAKIAGYASGRLGELGQYSQDLAVFYGEDSQEFRNAAQAAQELKAMLRDTTVELMKWGEWLKETTYGKLIGRGVGLLPATWQPRIRKFLAALDPASVNEAVNGLVNSLDEGRKKILTAFLSISDSLLSGNIPQAILTGIQALFGLATTALEKRLAELEGLFALYADKLRSAFDKITGSLGGVFGLIASIISDVVGMTFLEGTDLLRAGIDMAINAFTGLVGIIQSTIGSMASYKATHDAWGEIVQAVKDLFGEFLWPLAAAAQWLKKFLGITEEAGKALTASFNIPQGFKLARAAWGVAAPGQPWREEPSGIPEWAQEFGASLAAGIMAVLENLGLVEWGGWLEDIDSWGEFVRKIASGEVNLEDFQAIASAIIGGGDWAKWLDAIRGKAIELWTWITGRLPAMVGSVTDAAKQVAGFLSEHGITLDNILQGVKDFVDWLINDMPDDIREFLDFLDKISVAVVEVKDWVLANFPTWDELKAKIDEFVTALEGLDSLPGIKTEIQNITTAIDRLKDALTLALYTAAGAITGAIIGSAGFLSPAALIGALAGATAGGFLDWLSKQAGKGDMEWVNTGRGEGYWRRPSLQTAPGQWWDVERTGAAIVHQGETVGRGGGDTYVYNVTLPSVTNAQQFDEELQKIIRRKNLRKEGNRVGSYAMSGA